MGLLLSKVTTGIIHEYYTTAYSIDILISRAVYVFAQTQQKDTTSNQFSETHFYIIRTGHLKLYSRERDYNY